MHAITIMGLLLIFVVLTLSHLSLSHIGDFLSSLLDTLEGKHKTSESKTSESKSSEAK